jgi:hypothetical protein
VLVLMVTTPLTRAPELIVSVAGSLNVVSVIPVMLPVASLGIAWGSAPGVTRCCETSKASMRAA